jgi:hypothetical protein
MHRITINITQNEWDGLIQDMKDYRQIDERMKTQNYRRADFIYEDEHGRIEVKNVGFRTRGSSTRIIPEDDEGNYYRTHFAVRFNETFDLENGTDEYKKLHKREFCGLEKLNHNGKCRLAHQTFYAGATNYLCDDDHTNMQSPAAYFGNKRRTGEGHGGLCPRFEDYTCLK